MVALGKITRKFSLMGGAEVAYAGQWWEVPGDAASLGVAYEASLPGWYDDWKVLYPTSIEHVETIYQAVDPATGAVLFTSSQPGMGAGTQPEKALPPQCAVVVSVYTPFAGRSMRGRWYLPCPAINLMTDVGRLDPGTVNDLLAAEANLVQAAQTASGGTLGVWSRKNLSFTSAIQLSIGDVVDTQRSRRDSLVEARQTVSV